MPNGVTALPMPERFWSKVNKNGPMWNGTHCWIWLSSGTPEGYGLFWLHGKYVGAHRFAYAATIGSIPEGLPLDHLCRNPPCVNPKHLEAVTHQENLRRGNRGTHQRDKTHCPTGHEYNGVNTRVYKGRRFCRACDTARKEDKHVEKDRDRQRV